MSTTTSQQQELYWNKEINSFGNYEQTPITKEAKIVCIASPDDPSNDLLYAADSLPQGSEILTIATSVDELKACPRLHECNAVFCSHGQARDCIQYLLSNADCQKVEWIHTRSAGIDFVHSPTLASWKGGILTNAKGQFSSTLAEYSIGAMTYFAKDFARLQRSKVDKKWDKFPVQELRGSTLGIIGFGDIGKAVARLAKVYGMQVLALGRRKPPIDAEGLANESFDGTQLLHVLGRSDFVVLATPLTPGTKSMMGQEQFQAMKKGSVFINVGRGPTVDENALISALKAGGPLKGAGLDVFCKEPLPETSELWELDNVLLSPHNMDQTETFMHESVEFYCREQLPRFVRGLPLYNVADHESGY